MARSVDLAKGSRFIILASVCVVLAGLYFAQEVLIPIALAILLCFLLAPLVTRLERLRLGRVASTIIVTVAAVLLVVGLAYVVSSQILHLANDIPRYQENIVGHFRAFQGKGGVVQHISENVGELTKQIEKAPPTTQPGSQPASAPAMADVRSWRDLADVYNKLVVPPEKVTGSSPDKPMFTRDSPEPLSPWRTVLSNLSIVVSPLGTAGLVIVFAIFMLLQREDLRDRMIRLTGRGQVQLTTQALDDAGARISRYLLAQSMINGSYGAIIALGLWIIGLFLGRDLQGQYVAFPSVIVWGILCGTMRFIPYVGAWIGASLPMLLSFAVYPNNTPFVATVCLFVVAELLCANVFEPWLYGASTGLSTVAVLVAAVFWAWLWGPIGLLLSTPLTVCVVVIGKYVPQLQFIDILLGDEPVLDPSSRIYQRLVAMDQEEAADLAREYLKKSTIEDVYGLMLLPALSLAKEDRHRGQLDDERQNFVRKAMRDIIEEVGDLDREREAEAAAHPEVAAAKEAADAKATPPSAASPLGLVVNPRPALPTGCVVNVVCLPADDESDEIAGIMLARLLEARGYCAYPVSQSKLASEMVQSVETKAAHIVVISALPPSAVSHARYLCKRLHQRWPDVKMIVGLWTATGDMKRAKERITCADSVRLVPTFAETLETVRQLAQPVIVAASTERAAEVVNKI